jgi:hypothetical protein
MKTIQILAAAAIMASAGLAHAQDVAIAKRASIYSAEGTKLGRVDQVVADSAGKPEAIKVIYRGKFITIPASTLTSADKGLTTSLTNAALKKM